MKIDKINLQKATKTTTQLGFKASERKDLSLGNSVEFSKNSSMGISSLGKSQISKVGPQAKTAIGARISFTGGNPRQVVHFIAEGALTKGGGVATVINDWVQGWSIFGKLKNGTETQHNFFIPYYNGDVITLGGETHAFVQQDENGIPYFVNGVSSIDDVTETKGTKTKLKELFSSTFDDVDPNGNITKTPYTIFEATENIPKEFIPEGNNSRVFLVQVPKTATMSKQYGLKTRGDYAYMGGDMYDNYCQFSKATTDAMARHADELSLKEPTKAIKGEFMKFDPGSAVVHDWHPSAATAYMFNEAKNGNEMFKNMKVEYIAHNMGRGGYQGLGSPELDIFKNFATPQEFSELINCKEYRKVMSQIGPEGDKARRDFWVKLMPNLADETGTINPSMVPIQLAKNEYLNIAAVSPGYAEEITTNSEYAAGLTSHLKEAKDKGHLVGITNGLVKPTNETQISRLNCTYYSPQYFETLDDAVKSKFKYADGTPIKPMRTFDYNNLNIDEVAEVKKANKYNYLERLINFTKGKIKQEDLPEGVKPIHIVTTKDRNAKIMSTLTEDVLKDLKGDNPPKLFVSWGRGTEQKGFDEILTAIDRFVGSEADDGKSIFAICGGLGDDPEGSRIKKLIDKLMTEKNGRMKDRFAYIDGWGPADAMASAGDYAIFASRFEPCGLTAQEGYQRGCIAIGTETGGMRRTIIDFATKEKAGETTGFKTKSAYYEIGHALTTKDNVGQEIVNEEFIKELEATPEGKNFLKKFEKLKNEAKKDIERFNKITTREKENLGIEDLTKSLKPTDEASIINAAKGTPEFGTLLREYRDDVMSNQLAEQFKRAIGLSTDDMNAMRKFCIERPMDWINNIDTNDGIAAFEAHKACMGMGEKAIKTLPAKDVNISFINKAALADIISKGCEDAADNMKNMPNGACGAENLLHSVDKTAVGFMGKLKQAQDYVKGNKLATSLAVCAAALAGVWIYNGVRAKNMKKSNAPAPSVKSAPTAAPTTAPAPSAKPAPVAQATPTAQAAPTAQKAPATNKNGMQDFVNKAK